MKPTNRILILHGPNLNLLGKRQPEIYGSEGFEGFLNTLKIKFKNLEIDFFQSNHEGELIDQIQESEQKYQFAIINAGGYTHTSVAIADAVAAVSVPFIGIHISNIYQREPERHIDLLAKYCHANMAGFGLEGYHLALVYIEKWLVKIKM
jgi:3-dehydroquinate dehydratase II